MQQVCFVNLAACAEQELATFRQLDRDIRLVNDDYDYDYGVGNGDELNVANVVSLF